MVEHLQSGNQTLASENSAWQAMPHLKDIGCAKWLEDGALEFMLPYQQNVFTCGSRTMRSVVCESMLSDTAAMENQTALRAAWLCGQAWFFESLLKERHYIIFERVYQSIDLFTMSSCIATR